MHEILTASEAAEIMRCSKQYIVRLCKQKKLQSAKFGNKWLINRRDLYEFAGIETGRGDGEITPAPKWK